MPLLIAPVFNTVTVEPVRIELDNGFQLIGGNEDIYKLCHSRLRSQMNESKVYFDERVKPQSLFLFADYPTLKVKEDRQYITEIENRLNLANGTGICSIPYLLTMEKSAYGINYLKRSLDGPVFQFDPKTEDLFKKLLQTDSAFPTVPYRRFLHSLEKNSLEDELLDLWIALESLFVPDGKKGEITYKVRMRIAYYLGETAEERKKIADFIKRSYNHRSEIVHSGKTLGDAIREEITILRQIARVTLINLVMEKIKLQQLRERLDELVIHGCSYQEMYKPPHFEHFKERYPILEKSK
ncbi:HEPN domain-containing protein [Brevibacillus daliensis]|uniref:HEPN domain-containing protein n=1 Tax=Brevibacillus daliensis TaxID=2892995 RepID=UPI001E612F4D|nr:HEPN domain-containing protein [Brevibacillus daliensis]